MFILMVLLPLPVFYNQLKLKLNVSPLIILPVCSTDNKRLYTEKCFQSFLFYYLTCFFQSNRRRTGLIWYPLCIASAYT